MGGSFSLGRIFYKMRMRKSLEEAIKWYQQKKALRQTRDPSLGMKEEAPFSYNTSKRSKIIEIAVLKCYDLQRGGQSSYNSKEMQPFFYF